MTSKTDFSKPGLLQLEVQFQFQEGKIDDTGWVRAVIMPPENLVGEREPIELGRVLAAMFKLQPDEFTAWKRSMAMFAAKLLDSWIAECGGEVSKTTIEEGAPQLNS